MPGKIGWSDLHALTKYLGSSRTEPLVAQQPVTRVWDQTNFESMGWHDVHVHGFAAWPETYEVAFDIDYICSWEEPARGGTYFRFEVAPATLVFSNVSEVAMNIESTDGTITLDELQREELEPTPSGVPNFRWILSTHEGRLTIVATGYSLYLRQPPVLIGTQSLTVAERGGISFERGFE
jgi:hypothetical protein